MGQRRPNTELASEVTVGNGIGTSKQVFVRSLQELLQERRVGFEKQWLEGFFFRSDRFLLPMVPRKKELYIREPGKKLEKHKELPRQIILPSASGCL